MHVSDLADVHLAAMDVLEAGGDGGVFNCGYGRGYTVLEVLATLEAILARPVHQRRGPRRPGDVARAVADVDRLRAAIPWRPRHDNLEAILRSALAWRGCDTGALDKRRPFRKA
jgi:UDP-glucose 4-epimerase